MRQALEMALDWIKKQPEETPHSKYDVDTRYVVLREIEAALAQPEQKPVAQCTESDSWNCKYCRKTESCKALQDPRNFASPPQRKPLTYGQIRDLWARDNGLEDCHLCKIDDFIAAVRFVEAAHGIKE